MTRGTPRANGVGRSARRPVAILTDDDAWWASLVDAGAGRPVELYRPALWPDARAHLVVVDQRVPGADAVLCAPPHCPVVLLTPGDRPPRREGPPVVERWGGEPPEARHAIDQLCRLLDGAKPPPTLTACVLTRGDESRLAACLASIAGVVDEIVVQVDDRQPGDAEATARRFTPLVRVETPPLYGSDTPRIHFADARNRCAELATGDWVFVIDADEELTDSTFLREAVAHAAWAGMDGVGVRVSCHTDFGPAESAMAVRIYRRTPEIRWRYPAHNQLEGVGDVLASAAVVRSSYEGQGALADRVGRAAPALLAMYEAAAPGDPERAHAAFYLCRSYSAVHDHPRTVQWGRECIELCGAHPSVAPFWLWLAQAELALAGPRVARAVVDRGLAIHPDFADLWHLRMGLDLMEWTRAAEATGRGQGAFVSVPQRSLRYAPNAVQAAQDLGLPISPGGARDRSASPPPAPELPQPSPQPD